MVRKKDLGRSDSDLGLGLDLESGIAWRIAWRYGQVWTGGAVFGRLGRTRVVARMLRGRALS